MSQAQAKIKNCSWICSWKLGLDKKQAEPRLVYELDNKLDMSLTIKHISYLSKLVRFDNKLDVGLITYFYWNIIETPRTLLTSHSIKSLILSSNFRLIDELKLEHHL